jgi:hypothetical protein
VKTKLLVIGIFLTVCAATITTIFWKSELRYALPTPLPKNYKPVLINEAIALPTNFGSIKHEPKYLHFYNPDCPCSRFNAKHIKNLIQSYSQSIQASIVVFDEQAKIKAKDEFGDALPIVVDRDGAIAKACGVYSTPQAVIIDSDSKLYYRGNYNKARFCTVKATNFAELALISLLNGNPPPPPNLLATVSYGCQLPNENSIELY